MFWRRLGDKPLSEPVMTLFTDAYMRLSVSMRWLNVAGHDSNRPLYTL